ncbi:MAG: hypothetical protein JWM73_2338, partial [Solirubrobacterales bacterium]|nr:hypothetical protein [Solirubrobacterales bacterium]
GAAVVAWTTPQGIAVARAAGGRWRGRPVTLPASAGATGLDLSAGAGGQVALLWVAPDGARLALRPPGADAFGPAEAVPGEAGDLPVAFALPDGSVLATTTIADVARRTPDGAWGAGQPVAGDVALAVLAARAGAPAPVTVAHLDLGPVAADRTAFAWADGTHAALQEWGHFDNDNAFLIFGGGPPRTQGNRISAPGPTVVGGGEHGVPVAGARPGAITVYAAHAGRLYALDRPAAPDRRAPGIDALGPSTFRGSSPDRTVWMFASFTEAATAHVRAFVRQGPGWRRVAVRVLHGPQRIATGAPFEPVVLEMPLPVARGGCALTPRWRMRVRITARDGAGHLGRRTVLRTVACHED